MISWHPFYNKTSVVFGEQVVVESLLGLVGTYVVFESNQSEIFIFFLDFNTCKFSKKSKNLNN